MKPDSQNARIVAALADGCWHTVADIHRRAGYSRLNSRVSELRARGYVIEHSQTEGTGAHAHRYRLLASPTEGSEPVAGVTLSTAAAAAPVAARASHPAGSDQLTLAGVAA